MYVRIQANAIQVFDNNLHVISIIIIFNAEKDISAIYLYQVLDF